MVAILGFSKPQITSAVQSMYADVAARPDSPFHFPVGRSACRAMGYPDTVLDDLPDPAMASFAGVGYPFQANVIKEGQTVLDIGAGSGTDSLIASRLVGPDGWVWALDITPDMLARLKSVLDAEGRSNVGVIVGDAEQIPLPDNSVDVVTSNGALNLVPNKRAAFAEIFRVLRPEGRVQLADVVIKRPVPVGGRNDPKLWAECVVGASVDEDYLDLFRDIGFTDIDVLRSFDYFAESPSADTRQIATTLGARSIDVTMRRPAQPERTGALRRLGRRLHPRRLKSIGDRGLWGAVAALVGVLACYGTMALLPALALLGIGVTIDEGLWALTVAVAAGLALVATGFNMTRHGSPWPILIGAPGAIAVGYAMLVNYDPMIEALGFLVLISAVGLDLYQLYRAELCR